MTTTQNKRKDITSWNLQILCQTLRYAWEPCSWSRMHAGSSARDGGAIAWRGLQGSRTGNCMWVYVLGIVSRNMQQDVDVHTNATWRHRRTESRNINGSIIKGIWEIHIPGGAAMWRCSSPRTLQENEWLQKMARASVDSRRLHT
jgi:hypothetical protein